ncbi:MAG: carboxypeptidase-like regulatory domain-containing protein [Paludibacter sp.]
MKKLFSIVLISAAIFSLSAKGTASPEAKAAVVNELVSSVKLSGAIFDKTTNESLAGAVITVNGQKIYSDLDGKFDISNISGKVQVKVSMISYEEKTFEIDPSNSSTLKIELNQR